MLDARIKDHTGYGLLSVFTGDGRGKTTAALGTALRALGAGKRVAIVYFDKGGDAHYSERRLLEELGRTFPIEYHVSGRDRIDLKTGRFDFSILPVDKSEAQRGLAIARELFDRNEYDLVILDELNPTVSLGMLRESAALELLASKPPALELILTGRDAPASFLKAAHLVTEMKLHKHYFYSGVKAREGVDY